MQIKYLNEIADIRDWYEGQLSWYKGTEYAKWELDEIVEKVNALGYMLSLQRGYSLYEYPCTKPAKRVLVNCFQDRLLMLKKHYPDKATYRHKRMFDVCNYYLFKLTYDVWFKKLPETIPIHYSKVNTDNTLTLDDVDFVYDSKELVLIESALMHEIKTFGVKKFVERYTQYIQSEMYKEVPISEYASYLYSEDVTYPDDKILNYIIALVNIMCLHEGLECPVLVYPTLDKYLLPVLSKLSITLLQMSTTKKLELINRNYREAISLFRDRGFLYSNLDCCVG